VKGVAFDAQEEINRLKKTVEEYEKKIALMENTILETKSIAKTLSRFLHESDNDLKDFADEVNEPFRSQVVDEYLKDRNFKQEKHALALQQQAMVYKNTYNKVYSKALENNFSALEARNHAEAAGQQSAKDVRREQIKQAIQLKRSKNMQAAKAKECNDDFANKVKTAAAKLCRDIREEREQSGRHAEESFNRKRSRVDFEQN